MLLSAVSLGEVVDAIAAIQMLGNKIKHSAFALSVLDKLGFNFKEPPTDFDGLYVFALVEYGRNRPKPVLKLFADDTVKAAFRVLFEQSDPRFILEEIARIAESSELAQGLRRLEYNPDPEIREFESIFREFVESSRLPKEVEDHQLLKDVYEAILTQNTHLASIERAMETFASQSLRMLELDRATGYQLSHPTSEKDDPPINPHYCASRSDFLGYLVEQWADKTWLAISGGPGSGKTQTARMLADRQSSAYVWWVSLRSRSEDEATRHLKNQLALWLTTLLDDHHILLEFVTGRIGLNSIVQQIAERLNGNCLLVIDELPDGLENAGLFDTLAGVGSVLSRYAGRIITTGHRTVPVNLVLRLGDEIYQASSRPFNENDICEILVAAHAPEVITSVKSVSWLLAATTGNPAMVLAYVQWLRQNQWRLMDAVLGTEPIEPLRLYERRRFVSLCSESQHELLYRLTLVGTTFDKRLATRIANLPPPVKYPGAVLEDLTGPWVEQLEGGRLQVSPLLSEAGKDNLEESIQKAVHREIAADYESQKVLTPYKGIMLFQHLLEAKEFRRAANTIVQLMLSAKAPDQAKYIDWTVDMFVSGSAWPSGFDLNAKIMIRASQVRIGALANKQIDVINQDLDRLLDQATDENQLAVIFACLNAGPLVKEIPTATAIHRAVLAVPAFQSIEISEMFKSDMIEGAGNFVWYSLLERREGNNIFLFLEELKHTSPEVRSCLFNAEMAIEGWAILVDRLWMVESDKPEEEKKWDLVIDQMDSVYRISDELDIAPLKAAALRGKAIVICDFLGDPSRALGILENRAKEFESSYEFLLTYTQGLVEAAAGHDATAISTLQKALSIDTVSFAAYRTGSRKRIILFKEQIGQLAEAKAVCLECLKALDRLDPVDDLERCELLGELSWVHYRSNNWVRSATAIYAAILYLSKLDTDTPRYREVFNKIGHATGWLVSVASTGYPPAMTHDGEIYAPVTDGFFVSSQPRLSQYDPPIGLSATALFIQALVLADSLGRLSFAWHIHCHVKRRLRTDALQALWGAYQSYAASLEALFGSLEESLVHGLFAAKTHAFTQQLLKRKPERVKLPSRYEVESGWLELTEAQRVTAQLNLLYLVFGPAFGRILVTSANSSDRAERLVACHQVVDAHALEIEKVSYWHEAIAHFGSWIATKERGQWNFSLDDQSGDPLMHALAIWLASDDPHAPLIANFKKQLSVVDFLTRLGPLGKYMFWSFGLFIHRYWLNIAETRRFAIKHPDLFCGELNSIRVTAHPSVTAQIMRAVARALNVSLPNGILPNV
jgi:hypothetical protein